MGLVELGVQSSLVPGGGLGAPPAPQGAPPKGPQQEALFSSLPAHPSHSQNEGGKYIPEKKILSAAFG